MIRIEDLVKSRGAGFTLDIPRHEFAGGKITALLGPNGSGKSTLLRLIAGLDAADCGAIYADGLKLLAAAPASLAWRRAVTMVSQSPFMIRGTVAWNIGYGLRLRGISAAARRRTADEALALVGFPGTEARQARELSGGETQLVALARAIACRARVLLLDEPAAHIDRENAARIERVIGALRGTPLTIVLATHHLDQAYRLSDEVVSIIGGRLATASPENIFRGTAEGAAGALKTVTLAGGARIAAETPRTGPVHLTIDPAGIIVSRTKLDSSARNCLPGRVLSAASRGNLVRLAIDAGDEFTALLTLDSSREMGLQPGDAVYLTFKTTAVRVF